MRVEETVACILQNSMLGAGIITMHAHNNKYTVHNMDITMHARHHLHNTQSVVFRRLLVGKLTIDGNKLRGLTLR